MLFLLEQRVKNNRIKRLEARTQGKEETMEEENVNVEEQSTGAEEINYEEEIATNKKLQSFVDKKVTQGINTAIEKARKQWQLEIDTEKSEAEKLAGMNERQKSEYEIRKAQKEKNDALAELNAYKLKEQAIKIAGEKGLDVSLLDYFDYKTIKAEEIGTKIDSISEAFKNAVEKAVNERLKEPTPISRSQVSNSLTRTIPELI